jgi:superfamily II DNA or RNA helicase
VGSSNLSRSALEEGVEWNFRIVTSRDREGFAEATRAFEELFHHASTRPLDAAWLDGYSGRRRAPVPGRELDTAPEAPLPPPEPNDVQRQALAALERTREAGNRAGLVVLATGLGKTWLSAFDTQRPGFRRVLFVAHREEILTQAMDTFRRTRPGSTFGRYDGGDKVGDAEVVFASVQTLGRQAHLERFAPTAFDYLVVDEFHHASAPTYRRLLKHFTPRFLLGLTATPERSDGGDLLQLCGENLVFRCDVVEGIRKELLCPFHYFGVPDEVDYRNIPWKSTRFDEEALTQAVATQARAQNVLEQWQRRAGQRTLGFCVSQRHADFMARFFTERGVRCAAVHSGPTSAPRASSLEALAAGELQVVFAVDMFNEGVDLPAVDTVLMLRPTESSILWLQQFGRGLRRAAGKERLVVVDYIGNHRAFLLKPRTLLQLKAGDDRELSAALERLQRGEWELPPGCEVTYELEAVELMRGLLRLPRADDALRSYYEDFRERHGVRPTATEAHHDGYAPRSARRGYGSWLGLVRAMGDLTEVQQAALGTAGAFLESLETTPMTESYKMLVLQALLNLDALPGEAPVDALVHEFRRLAERTASLRKDAGDALGDERSLRSMLLRNPLAAWTEGRGTGDVPYFALQGEQFRFLPRIEPRLREAFQGLVRELVDWRLAEYLEREAVEAGGERFEARVSHTGGRPIVFLPNRERTPSVPHGWTPLSIEGKQYEANFAQVALNVVRAPGSTQNELPAILRTWFGPDAGLPGTHFLVACEPEGDGYRLSPAREARPLMLERWREYAREQIPPLFGLTFSEAIWHSGFVPTPKHLFLLVTLEKEDLASEFHYADQFLGPDVFQWQSQNRTRQEGKHGKAIRNHGALGLTVELFVRRAKRRGGGASPFLYCGPVSFLSWEGERPITVRWSLSEPVPQRLWEAFKVGKPDQ